MREITYRQAVNEALAEEMERDPNVFLMGEEVAEYNGAYKISQGLLERFGPKRVIDSPIAEAGFAGLGVGAAMAGLRPIIEFMTFSFSLVAFDQIVNNAPNMLTMSGGQFHVPVVFRGPNGPAHQLGATHSHATECWYANVPGLKIVMPATPPRRQGPAQDRRARRQPRARPRKRDALQHEGRGGRPGRRFARAVRQSRHPPARLGRDHPVLRADRPHGARRR